MLKMVFIAAMPVAVTLLAESDALSGGAGWVGAGLLGAVLSWLMLKHLPAKDAQLREIMHDHRTERIEMDTAHRNETTKDRDAFDSRAARIESAIKEQTLVMVRELKDMSAALKASCRFERRDDDKCDVTSPRRPHENDREKHP